MESVSRRQAVHRMAWFGSVALILWWTLLPFQQDLSPAALQRAFAETQWVPFVERGRFPLWSDVLANFVLFVPFGFTGWRSLSGKGHRLWPLLVAGALLSLGVEVVQLSLPARRTSASDLATDVIGVLAGAGLGRLWELHGREALVAWAAELRRGAAPHRCLALFLAALVAWAVLPGNRPDVGLWAQVQGFSSSFRRFPGLAEWFASSLHLLLFGWLLGVLAGNSAAGGGRVRPLFGAVTAVAAGLLVEMLQLLVPGREPQIFQALALGAGGIPGGVTALLGRTAQLVGVAVVCGIGLVSPPAADTWAAATRVGLFLGVALAVCGVWVRPKPAGGTDPEPA